MYAKFFIDDIDIENVDTYNKYAGTEKGFVLETINNYNNISTPLKGSEDYKTSRIPFYTSDHYNLTRFFNAMKYLISSALEHGYRRDDKNDPFVSSPSEAKGTSATGNTVKSEYRVQLKETNGVFSLNVSINGVWVNFILDSGAGESNISSNTERELLQKGVINQTNYLSNGLYKLADGSISECKSGQDSKINCWGKDYL